MVFYTYVASMFTYCIYNFWPIDVYVNVVTKKFKDTLLFELISILSLTRLSVQIGTLMDRTVYA